MWWFSFSLSLVLTALLASAVNWLAMGKFRRAAAAHWTERARLLWPVRKGAVFCGLAIPLAVLSMAGAWLPHGWVSVWGFLVGGFLGGILGGFVMHHAAFPFRKFHQWLALVLSLSFIRYGALILWLIAGVNAFSRFSDWVAWVIAAFIAQLVMSLGLWLWPLRWMRLLVPASPELGALVRDLSQSMGIPVRHVWETAPVAANALASPLWGAVIVSRETMEVLRPEELRSILAHELGHLAEPRRVTVLRIVGSWWLAPLAGLRWAVESFGAVGALGVLACCIIWLRLALRLSRSEEHRVDAVAKDTVGSGEVSARALERLHEAGLIPAVLPKSQSTHPSLYDRMLAAGVTPEFERPRSPSRLALNGWIAIGVWVAFMIWQVAAGFQSDPPDHPHSHPEGSPARMRETKPPGTP